MKKLFRGALLALLALCFTAASAAAQPLNSYTVDRAGMTLGMPEDWAIFTRDVEANDPNLALFEMDRDSLLQTMGNANIYLTALQKDPMRELTIKVSEDDHSKSVFYYKDLEEDRLEEEKQVLVDSIREVSGDRTVSDPVVLEHPQTTFLQVEVEQETEAGKFSGVENHTVINGQAISISVYVLDAEGVTEDLRALLADVTESVSFQKIYTDPAEAERELYPPTSVWSMILPILLFALIIGGIFFLFWLLMRIVRARRDASIRKTLKRVVAEQEERKKLNK